VIRERARTEMAKKVLNVTTHDERNIRLTSPEEKELNPRF
jgi:hypothetical protein